MALTDDQKVVRNDTGKRIATALERIADGGNEVADAYSSSATYAVGDYCIYNNTLYKCSTAITTAEAWTPAHWTATTVADELHGKLGPADVVDNLTSGGTTVPLSAEQGKAIYDRLIKMTYTEISTLDDLKTYLNDRAVEAGLFSTIDVCFGLTTTINGIYGPATYRGYLHVLNSYNALSVLCNNESAGICSIGKWSSSDWGFAYLSRNFQIQEPIKVTDCNNATDPFLNYYTEGNASNSPTSGLWYFIRVLNKSGLMVTQIASAMNVTTPKVYVRSSTNTGTFGSWAQIV